MNQKQKSVLYQVVFFFLCLAVGALIGALLARSDKSAIQLLPALIELLIFIPALIVLQIIIHEAGHMLAALVGNFFLFESLSLPLAGKMENSISRSFIFRERLVNV